VTTAFKVLVDGASCHGGSLTWSLPTNDAPGEWHEVTGKIEACSTGLHLTTTPANWWKEDARVFETEYDGDTDTEGDKIAVRRARLLREVSWDDHQVWSAGDHAVSSGRATAYGSATVTASGSATVRASGSANAIRTRWHRGGYIKLSDLAVVIDRRFYGTVTFHAAPYSDKPAPSSSETGAPSDA
jgi:hypothetical protein